MVNIVIDNKFVVCISQTNYEFIEGGKKMSFVLDDGRYLMATWSDIHTFFETNDVRGKIIKSIVPSECDYAINNWEEIESSNITKIHCSTSTDGYVSIVFEDDSSVEIEIPGSAPIILGTNNRPNDKRTNSAEYSMDQLFSNAIGKRVVNVEFEKTSKKMIFPCYCGIDMSKEDEGINKIKVVLEDGSYLYFEGQGDFFNIKHFNADGTSVMISVDKLRRK